MTHRSAAWLSAWLLTAVRFLRARVHAAPQAGQGTVEYVALILLVAGVLAVAVTAAGKSGTAFDFGGVVTKQMTNAISKVTK